MALGPSERWMVRSNLDRIDNGDDPEVVVATLRANGYLRVAAAVETEMDVFEVATPTNACNRWGHHYNPLSGRCNRCGLDSGY